MDTKIKVAKVTAKVPAKQKFDLFFASEKELNQRGFTRQTASGHILPIREKNVGDAEDFRTGKPLPKHPHVNIPASEYPSE